MRLSLQFTLGFTLENIQASILLKNKSETPGPLSALGGFMINKGLLTKKLYFKFALAKESVAIKTVFIGNEIETMLKDRNVRR